MTLTDAGPLVALIDADEADHRLCAAAVSHLPLPLLTTWPAFTEAMCLLVRGSGSVGRDALWKLVLSDRLRICELTRSALERTVTLMSDYADLPMDLADATIVAYAEEQSIRRVFTLDRDFLVYRLRGRDAFEVVPGLTR